MRNTKRQGKFTLFVYREKPNYYIGVCLEFDLIQEGKTIPETMERIKGASTSYLKTVIKFNMDDDLLNRKAPKEHWKKFKLFQKKKKEEEKRRDWEKRLQELFYDPKFLKEKLNV